MVVLFEYLGLELRGENLGQNHVGYTPGNDDVSPSLPC